MLDTVLEIGSVLRNAPDGLKHHRYIKKPQTDEKSPLSYFSIPVDIDGSFDFSRRTDLEDEVTQKACFYLNYKSSDADSTKPYIFGDIYRSVTRTGEDGNFRFGDPEKKSWMALNSFQRASEIKAIPTQRVANFRQSFDSQMGDIEEFLGDHPRCYLQFDFGGFHWHQLTDEMEQLNEVLLATFFTKTEQGYVLSSFLYKSLSAGGSRVPGFIGGAEYKTRIFKDTSQALDLLYAVNYASHAAVRKNDVKVVILPRGKGLTASVIERFFDWESTEIPVVAKGEEILKREVAAQTRVDQVTPGLDDPDEIFAPIETSDPELREIAQFDFIFSKAGGTKADIDMVEIAGLDRSKLSVISRRVSRIRSEVESKRSQAFSKAGWAPSKWGLGITSSFKSILGDATKGKKKYQNHLLRVLPQIYTGCYFDDPVLLPALVEKVEFGVRNDEISFTTLQYPFYFLLKIQDYRGDRLMEIQESQSYQIGAWLGKLAKQFAGQNSPIKSFEKNYVGLLSRRIGTMADVVKLANDINQKLIMHGLLYPNVREAANELAVAVKNFEGRYDRNQCAFGFFESYFAYCPKGDGSADGADTPSEQPVS